MAAEHTQHIQKSLSLMNLQIHHVLSDITGASGLAILDAILAGNRDPLCLAHLCNIRVKSPRETVVYRPLSAKLCCHPVQRNAAAFAITKGRAKSHPRCRPAVGLGRCPG